MDETRIIVGSSIIVKDGVTLRKTQYLVPGTNSTPAHYVTSNSMPFQYNDGGRSAAGFKGEAGDCVTRAISIATGIPYLEVYDALNEQAQRERPRKGKGKRSSARTGVRRPTYERYLSSLGWTWVPTMQVGSGCKVHLKADELPNGRLLVAVSRHMVAVINGVVHDTDDPSRGGTRCVYGYYLCAQMNDHRMPGHTHRPTYAGDGCLVCDEMFLSKKA